MGGGEQGVGTAGFGVGGPKPLTQKGDGVGVGSKGEGVCQLIRQAAGWKRAEGQRGWGLGQKRRRVFILVASCSLEM